jgi:hypothetical protein
MLSPFFRPPPTLTKGERLRAYLARCFPRTAFVGCFGVR